MENVKGKRRPQKEDNKFWVIKSISKNIEMHNI